jgi:hypothetical protein
MSKFTERQKVEEELRRTCRLLAALTRAQDRFVLDAETRAPFEKLLNTVLSLTESEYGFIGEVLFTQEGAPT